jgi:hypothetical protein
MMELDDFDTPFEAFEAAQGGAVAHLETMSAVAREVAEDALALSGPGAEQARIHAARLSQVAEKCDALGVLIALLDLPRDADWPG